MDNKIKNILDKWSISYDSLSAVDEDIIIEASDFPHIVEEIESYHEAQSKISNSRWAVSREETAKVREKIAIRFMLEYYVDEELTEESLKQAINDYYNRK